MPDDALADDLLALALEVARAGGDFAFHERPDDLITDTKSSPTDVVTQMDRATESLLVTAILAQRPDDGILGEEGGERPGTSGVRWVLDPIDGTTNYLYGLPVWAVSVGVEVDGEVVAGVVEAPALGRRYLARRGAGAWEEAGEIRRPLRASGGQVLAEALVSTGFAYTSERRARQAEDLRQLAPLVRDIRRLGAASIDLAWVGAGYVDAFFESGLHAWDVAAGGLVASEAGAIVSVLPSGSAHGDITLAAAPGVHDALRDVLLRSVDPA